MKKIMFNDKFLLTQAVLEGRKTQTRRIEKSLQLLDGEDIKGQKFKFGQKCKFGTKEYHFVTDDLRFINDCDGRYAIIARTVSGNLLELKPKYCIGENVAIAQCYNDIVLAGYDIPNFLPSSAAENKMFVSSKFMPHHIRITDVRIERLQDISNEDCLKEGIKEIPHGKDASYFIGGKLSITSYSPKIAYAELIDRICGRGTWDKNPYVFVYDFELID